jgi:hypothetical protein
MGVMGMPIAIVARVGRVPAVAIVVGVIVVMVTVPDGVAGYIVNQGVDGEHRRVKRHETDECKQSD